MNIGGGSFQTSSIGKSLFTIQTSFLDSLLPLFVDLISDPCNLTAMTSSPVDVSRLALTPPSANYRLLAPLCVKPSAQGQGVGSALLQYVSNIVDKDNETDPNDPVPIYLDASKAGQPVYLKAGYEYFPPGPEGKGTGREFPGMIRWGKVPVEKRRV
jgi:GNAT superfamily N-acetyltransferase